MLNTKAKLSRWKRAADKRQGAVAAAAAIVNMDPGVREDLISYLKALNDACAAGSEDEQEYVLNAILELLGVESEEPAGDLEDWQRDLAEAPGGQEAAAELAAGTEQFFRTYQRLKAQTGLTTIRAVAEAAGISPTTVQAIEKQRVKPQFKTIRALAKAFGVDPSVLTSGR